MNKKIKVVSYSGSKIDVPRGTPLRVLRLVAGLSRRNDVDLTIFSTDEQLPIENVTHIRLKGNDSKQDYLRVIKYINKEEIDVVVGHTLKSLRLLLLVKIFTKAKFILEIHGFIAEEALFARRIGKARYIINKQLHKIAFSLADCVTTFIPKTTECLKKYNRNTYTLSSGSDTKLFKPNVKPRYNFKKNDHTIVIGYSGNTAEYQGLDFLRNSFDLLLSSKKYDLHLALLLSDNNDNTYGEKITVIGRLPQKDVPSFLSACDILVLPRPSNIVTEISFASKLIDYMSMGKPVVASNVGGVQDVIVDGINGCVYEPDNFDEFSKKISLLTNPNVREEIGKSARKTVDNKYTITKINDEFYELLQKLS